jgi:putative MATE family efflux protein
MVPRVLRSPYDREIAVLAVPALGALAAGPMYVLADTAIVGHLGTPQLAALALAAIVVSSVTDLSDFLSYGTTAQVARLHGAGDEGHAGGLAAQALWLAVVTGVLVGVLIALAGPPLMQLFGPTEQVSELAATYMRITAIGVPFMLVALAAEGYLRGVGDLKTPLVILVICNALNNVLEVLFVYGFDWGLEGSAWGTVIAQVLMGALFARLMLIAPADSRRPMWSRMRPLVRMGGDLTVRSAALLGAFTLGSVLAARLGTAQVAAHNIAFQLFIFLALVLDAIAIAGQILVGRALGASRGQEAWAASRRMIGWALVVGGLFMGALLALTDVIPRIFTSDPAVIEQARSMWPLFAIMQPAAGVVFALDGVLIGAGDTRFLALAMIGALAVYVPLAFAAGTLAALWWALLALMAVRLATVLWRFAGRRWIVLGAATPG